MRGFLATILVLAGGNSWAHVSSISAGTAESGRAAVETLDTPFLNPAALPYQQGYFFGTGASRFRSDTLGDIDLFSLSLTDNMPDTVVPTALGYVQTKYDLGKQPWERKDLRLGVGNFIYGRNALGLGFAYRSSRAANVNVQQYNVFTGAMFSLGKEFSLALVVENPINAPRDIPGNEVLNYSTALGLSYNYKTFLRLKFDVISDSPKPTLAAGIENYWNRWLIVRFGYSKNSNLNQNITAAGVGFQGPRFSMHYAFENVQSEGGLDPRHSIDMAVPIW